MKWLLEICSEMRTFAEVLGVVSCSHPIHPQNPANTG
jgi:hypothetical protein